MDPATKALRQLTFDQDSDNDPTVLNDGRVLYQRWEYSDIPHYFSRRRMTMNPDGTGQLAFYGSNSWFPTAFRFAKPVPDHPTRLVGIISGHHDFGDCGRMAILDPGLAGGYPFRYRPTSKEWGVEGEPIAVTPDVLPAEQTGFLQLVPGRGKTVAGTVCDAIIGHVYRKELPALTTHPYPLSSKYFLVSMKPTPQSLWGIYLVDVFDNATLIAEIEGAALFEPQPLMPRPRPPVIPDRVEPDSRTAEVHIADIYSGPGLQGVPRGTVKRLRVFSYHFGYNGKAGFPLVGTQAGWDVKRVLGTATVEPDGSAYFEIPANTPVSIQPLDEEGRAVQLMRSWFVGMPGERFPASDVTRTGGRRCRRDAAWPTSAGPNRWSRGTALRGRLPSRTKSFRSWRNTVSAATTTRRWWAAQQAFLQGSRHRLRHAPSVRPSAGRGSRHGVAESDGVPRVDQPADPDAGEGASRREAGRDEPRSAGAALLLDRLERAPRGQLESPGVPGLRSAAAALRTGQSVCQQRRRSGRRARGGGRGVPEPNADPSSSLRRRKSPSSPTA